MTIFASNLIINGTIGNIPALYTNNINTNTLSNININSDVNIKGIVACTRHLDVGDTIFATFRLSSNLALPATGGEASPTSTQITGMDMTSSDVSGMSNIPMSVPKWKIFNGSNGIVTIPTSGLYNISVQGSFSASNNIYNAVYLKFLNHTYSNARVGVAMTSAPVVHTSVTKYLLSNDLFLPCFYSTGNDVSVVGGDGESYVQFSMISSVTPTHSNYRRL